MLDEGRFNLVRSDSSLLKASFSLVVRPKSVIESLAEEDFIHFNFVPEALAILVVDVGLTNKSSPSGC